MDTKTRAFTLRFEPQEWDRIERLAKASGRARGDVVRKLVEHSLPEARHLLGNIEPDEVKHEQITT